MLGNVKATTGFSTFFDRGIEISNPRDIVEHFNDYFVNIGTRLAEAIHSPSTDFTSYLDKTLKTTDSFVLHPTDAWEIIRIVNGFAGKSSCGVDGLPVNLMKECIVHIAEPLSALINVSFCTGVVPDSLKIAKICPIYKGGGEHDFSNYRPISVLPSFSKIYEKAVYNRLSNYFNTKHFFIDNQYGFRPSYSTFMALQDMYDKISQSIEHRESSIGVFLDLSKAFDTVNHDILLCKLSHYGVRGVALEWFSDYLTRRKQCVVFNGVTSDLKNILCGVPQGSILGPLLFIIYVNDITNCSKLLHFILFADDTNIFYSNKCQTGLICTLNFELSLLSDWFRANKLSLNVKKSNYIVFGNNSRESADCAENVVIDGIKIEKVSSTKFVGVYIDENLNWKQHTFHTASKISRSLGMINRVKYILSHDLLLTLYRTMIHPYLLYCNILWGNASMVALKPLILLQKRAVRVITGSDYRAHSNPLFARLSLLNLADINNQQVLLFMYRFKHSLLPSSSCRLLSLSPLQSNYCLRRENDFVLEKYRTVTRKRGISIHGPDLWRSLPDSLKSADSLLIFKRELTRSFFEGYLLVS